MGRRSRRRERETAGAVERAAVTAYTDPEGNVLTLRDRVSAGTVERIRRLDATPGSSLEDRAARRDELLFERLAVRWEVAGLPLEGERELLGRYRMATADERRWIRETIQRHVTERQPELAG